MHRFAHHRKPEDTEALLYGAPLRTMLRFALPILLGNIFQQLYNIVDAMVVGRYLGDAALSGISVASPIVDVCNALVIGASIGVGVLAAQLCGAAAWDRLRLMHTTALTGGLVAVVLLSVLGIVLSGPLLRAQGVEAHITAQAITYLTIVFFGFVFCFLYHYYATLLRSCGNSRVPFIILLVFSTLHALLDVVLVGLCRMGIAGVAISTVVCQALSAIACILYTVRHYPHLSFTGRQWQFQPAMGRQVLAFAWAAALQQAVISIGRLLVQGTLTPLGSNTVTGYNMAMRTENLLFCFSQGIAAAMVVCLSQNFGHGDKARVRQFYYRGLAVNISLWCVLGAVCFAIPQHLTALYSANPEVIAAGGQYTGTMAFFYLAAFLGETIQSFFRSIGKLKLTMVASILQVLLRVILSFLLVPRLGMMGICIAVATGWCLLVLIEGSYSLYKAKRV